MNNRMLHIFVLVTSFQNFIAQANTPKTPNKLNWIEISHNKLSVQIMFDFAHPIACNPKVAQSSQQLLFAFPDMELKNFNAAHVTTKLTQLQTDGLLKKFMILDKNSTQKDLSLSLEFPSHRQINNTATNANTTVENKFLIKWSMLEKPHRLIVDIFLKENLDKLVKKDAVLLYATNNTQQYDTIIPEALSAQKQLAPATKKMQRVIIDPGHGGSNTGAQGYQAIREKDITLDISKRVHAMLKKKGQKSLLIRSVDKDMSLLERAQLAHQLQGDLFVSIHANSSGNLDCSPNSPNGIETFYLDGNNLLASHHKTGFLFINQKKDSDLIDRLNNYMQESHSQSKLLAEHIQKSVLNTLAQNNIIVTNRGVKKEKFRVLLQMQPVPTTLVEVGFVTNPQEASRLAKPAYRNLIAQGICDGICSYLSPL